MSKDQLKHTIVGGRPNSKNKTPFSNLPVGLEAIIVKASVDKELYQLLTTNKEEFLNQPDLPLTEIEKEMLKSISQKQLLELISNCTPPKEYFNLVKTASITALIAFVTNLGIPSLLYAFNKDPDQRIILSQTNLNYNYEEFNLSNKDRITRGISPDLIDEDEEDTKVEGIRPSLPHNIQNSYNASSTNIHISLDAIKNTIVRTEVSGLTLSEALQGLQLETSIPIEISASEPIDEKTKINVSIAGLSLYDALYKIFISIVPDRNQYSIKIEPVEDKIIVNISKNQ